MTYLFLPMTSTSLNVVFLDRATLPESLGLATLDFPHQLTLYEHSSPSEALQRVVDADIVITNKVPITAELLEQAPKLKLVAVAATGINMIDLEACAAHQVAVSNVRDYAGNTVPEHVLALIFALRRSLLPYHRSIAAGRWQEANQFCYFDYPIQDLAGSTLGIIGAGSLGQSLATLAKALGMNVIFSARKGASTVPNDRVPFEELLRTADIISLHCPLTADTTNLIGAPEFAHMQRRPLLINTARGGLIDEHALAHALQSGQIAGAGIDVTTPEPPQADNPLLQLMDLPNFIFTPHVAWASREAIQALADQLIANINAFVRGEPRNLV